MKGDVWNYSVEAARAGTAHAYIYDDNPVEMYAELRLQGRQSTYLPPCTRRQVNTKTISFLAGHPPRPCQTGLSTSRAATVARKGRAESWENGRASAWC